MTKSVEKSRKVRKIRDIIHEYIEITSIEESLINSPLFQRLRYISQNSLAYYTYPCNGINRFAHSLGVMHLGGLMFSKALANSNREALTDFVKHSEELIKTICEGHCKFDDVINEWRDLFGNVSGFNHHPVDLSEPAPINQSQLASLNIIWQSVRIACMMHDIGHFPYSHLFEHAIDDFLNNLKPDDTDFGGSIRDDIKQRQEKYREYLVKHQGSLGLNKANEAGFTDLPLHETQGVLILKALAPPKSGPSEGNRLGDIKYVCLTLAKAIFIHNKSTYEVGKAQHVYGLLDSLHTLVSSEIDADRLDYCRRDPKASGVELGAFDIDRVIESIVLIKTEDTHFKIVYGITGISGIESFFHQRFLIYEYIIFHHNVVRMDATLEHVINLVFQLYSSNETISSISREHGLVNPIEGSPNRVSLLSTFGFEHYDDYWLKTLLNRIYIALEKTKKEKQEHDLTFQFEDKVKELFICLEIVLFRNNNHIYSLWKRNEDFIHDLDTIIGQLQVKGFKVKDKEGNEVDGTEKKMKNEIIRRLNPIINKNNSFATKRMRKIKSELEVKGLYLIGKKLKKRIFADKEEKYAEIYCRDGKLKPVHEVSTYLNSLKYAVENSVEFNLFIIGQDIKRDKALSDFAREVLLNNITEFIMETN